MYIIKIFLFELFFFSKFKKFKSKKGQNWKNLKFLFSSFFDDTQYNDTNDWGGG